MEEDLEKSQQSIKDRIKWMFPTQNKIELFARQKTEGWDVWGNEVESDIILLGALSRFVHESNMCMVR